MAVDVTTPAPAAYDEWREPRWRWGGAFVGLLVLALGVAMFFTGETESTYGDLVGAVADGEVSQVEVNGLPGSDDWRGTGTMTFWWQGTVRHYAEVRVESRRGEVRDPDPVEKLMSIDPDLAVVEVPHRYSRWDVLGWSVPQAVWWAGLVAFIAVFVMIVSGPLPWRATRWAWFWLLVLAPPVGLFGYAFFGGPLEMTRPADTRRRLTGGWAFLLAGFVFAGWRDRQG